MNKHERRTKLHYLPASLRTENRCMSTHHPPLWHITLTFLSIMSEFFSSTFVCCTTISWIFLFFFSSFFCATKIQNCICILRCFSHLWKPPGLSRCRKTMIRERKTEHTRWLESQKPLEGREGDGNLSNWLPATWHPFPPQNDTLVSQVQDRCYYFLPSRWRERWCCFIETLSGLALSQLEIFRPALVSLKHTLIYQSTFSFITVITMRQSRINTTLPRSNCWCLPE